MAAKKTSKKSAPKKKVDRKALGREAVAKGKSFEDKVADLYKLMGFEVTQNIMIANKKVDILAEFTMPGGNTTHKIIVECKNEAKRVNDLERVAAFDSIVEDARKLGEADSAEIITKVPWSDPAKASAKRKGIGLLTYHQKLSKLIDFEPYLKGLIEKFEEKNPARPTEPPLGAYYVDLSAELIGCEPKEEIPVIDTHIFSWLEKKDYGKQLAIFGEYGTGKSTLCQKIARDLARAFLEEPENNRIPILLNLRDFIGKIQIDAFITSFLDKECDVPNPKYKLFEKMNEAGIFLLIFDGFDEMAVKVDAETLESNLSEIDKLTATPESKAILTSRPEHFITGAEQEKALIPPQAVFGARDTHFEPVKILPWKDEQVDAFLEKRVPLIKGASQSWTYYKEKIKDIDGLSDLSQRPVLLEIIVKTLPTMIKENIEINLMNLYETYLRAELVERQKKVKKRTFLLKDEERLQLLEKAAFDLYFNTIENINFSNSRDMVKSVIKPFEENLESYTRDFLTNSLLIKKGDDYVFSHKSIYDYIIAKIILREIDTKSFDFLGFRKLGYLPLPFLQELKAKTDILFDMIYSTRNNPENKYPFLGGNAAILLKNLNRKILFEEDLSETDLTGANLADTDLSKTILKETNLRDADLTYAKFNMDNIRLAKLFNTKFLLKVKVSEKRETALLKYIKQDELVRKKIGRKKNLMKYHPQKGRWKYRGMQKIGTNYAQIEVILPENISIDEMCREFSETLSMKVDIYNEGL